jgi:hypothetical protein
LNLLVADGQSRARSALIAIGLLVGSAGSVGLGFWHRNYDPDKAIPYDDFSPIHESWWAWHMFGGLANTLMMVALAIAACVLAQRRGAVWANVGAATTLLGGLLFGAAVAAEGAAMGYAGDPDALPRQAGAALLRYINDHPEMYVVPIIPGLVLSTLGPILISVALWRARSVPSWIPIALFAGTVAGFFAPMKIGWIAGIPAAVATIAIGWYVWSNQSKAETVARG